MNRGEETTRRLDSSRLLLALPPFLLLLLGLFPRFPLLFRLFLVSVLGTIDLVLCLALLRLLLGRLPCLLLLLRLAVLDDLLDELLLGRSGSNGDSLRCRRLRRDLLLGEAFSLDRVVDVFSLPRRRGLLVRAAVLVEFTVLCIISG